MNPSLPLQGQTDARVAIIGGGYAGLNTALGLAERGVRDVVLLEREQIGFGASGRNGGFVFGGYSLGEQSLLDQRGEAQAQALFKLTTEAVERIRQQRGPLCHSLRCGRPGRDLGQLVPRPCRVASYARNCWPRHYGVEWDWLPQDELRERVSSERYYDGLYERNALHLHPLNFAIGLAGARPRCRACAFTRIRMCGTLHRDGTRWRIETAQGEVHADQVVLACGGYLAGLRRQVDRAILPIATYVMVTEPLGDRLAECLHTQSRPSTTRASPSTTTGHCPTRACCGEGVFPSATARRGGANACSCMTCCGSSPS